MDWALFYAPSIPCHRITLVKGLNIIDFMCTCLSCAPQLVDQRNALRNVCPFNHIFEIMCSQPVSFMRLFLFAEKLYTFFRFNLCVCQQHTSNGDEIFCGQFRIFCVYLAWSKRFNLWKLGQQIDLFSQCISPSDIRVTEFILFFYRSFWSGSRFKCRHRRTHAIVHLKFRSFEFSLRFNPERCGMVPMPMVGCDPLFTIFFPAKSKCYIVFVK